jgi:predicted DNA-binding protein (MmcQ/YjbR family)
MNVEEIRECCLSIKGADESFPFRDDTIIAFKVMGKMFAYMSLAPKEDGFKVDLKCDPDKAIELREKYESVVPGWHGKEQWNSIYIEGDMPDDEIKVWVEHSVEEVIKKLSKKAQAEYAALKNEK